MALGFGPNIITDGLVLNIDPASIRSYSASNDPYRDHVSLMMDFENGIIDKSKNNFSITVGGSAQISSQSKYGGGSIYIPSMTSYLSLGVQSNFSFGTDDFTIEMWIQFTNSIANKNFLDFRPSAGNGSYPAMYVDTYFKYFVSSADRIVSATSPTLGQWYHVAVSRSSGSTRMFINGIQEGSTYADSTNYSVSRGPIIGNGWDLTNYGMTGYIDDIRITKGIARYTSNFTPPGPLSAPGKMIDIKNKRNGTLTNNPIFSNVQNGLIALDGTNDYIDLGSDFTADFSTGTTVEIWGKFNSLSSGGWERLIDINNGNNTVAFLISRYYNTNGIAVEARPSPFDNTTTQRGSYTTNSVISPGTIQCFTITIGAGTINNAPSSAAKIYVNGINQSLTTYGSSAPYVPNCSSNRNFYIGKSAFSQDAYLNANIYSVKIYNKEFTADQVLQNYNAIKQRFVEIPKTVSGLQLWLDAADLSTLRQNSDGTTTTVLNNDPVGYWLDKSGNGRHATQGTAGNKPLYKLDSNGLPYINLDGSASVLTGSFGVTLSGMTFFAVFSIGNGGYNSGRMFTQYNSAVSSYDWNTTGNLITMYKPGSMNTIGFAIGNGGGGTSHTLSYDQNYLYHLVSTGSTTTSYINNAGAQSINSSVSTTYDTYLIGREPNYNGYILGKAREFIYYNRNLSSAETTQILNYLNNKWGVF